MLADLEATAVLSPLMCDECTIDCGVHSCWIFSRQVSLGDQGKKHGASTLPGLAVSIDNRQESACRPLGLEGGDRVSGGLFHVSIKTPHVLTVSLCVIPHGGVAVRLHQDPQRTRHEPDTQRASSPEGHQGVPCVLRRTEAGESAPCLRGP